MEKEKIIRWGILTAIAIVLSASTLALYHWFYCVKLTIHIETRSKNDICEFIDVFTYDTSDEYKIKEAFSLLDMGKISKDDCYKLLKQLKYNSCTIVRPQDRRGTLFIKRLPPGLKIIRARTENCGDWWDKAIQLEKDSEIYLTQKDKYSD